MTEKLTIAEYRAVQPTLPGTNRATHANRGAIFEDALNLVHRRVYDTEKTGFVAKNNLDWVYTSARDFENALAAKRISPAQCAKTLDGKYLVARQTKPDFEGGCIFEGELNAVHVLFDAKQTKGKSLPLANIKRHQIESLAIASLCGSIAGIMVLLSDLDRVFFLPALVVREFADQAKYAARVNNRAASGSQSISVGQMEEFGIEIFKVNSFWTGENI